jgi:hypothetical protein
MASFYVTYKSEKNSNLRYGNMLVQHMKCILLVMFRAPSFHAGPESDITNLKKSKKCETFAWRYFM